MRNIFRKLMVGFLISLTPGILLSQWEMAQGLDGGKVTQLSGVDSFLFASCCYHGVHSNVSGKWEIAYDDPNSFYRKLATAGNCVFIYDDFYDNNCLRSFNLGSSWEPLPQLGNILDIWNIDTMTFFLSEDHTLLSSSDYGTGIDTVQIPNIGNLSTVYIDGRNIYLYYWDGWTWHKILYSSDCGNNWDSLNLQGLFPEYYSLYKIMYVNNAFWAITNSNTAPYSSTRINVFDSIYGGWIDVTKNLPRYRNFMDLTEYKGRVLCSYSGLAVYKFNFLDSTWTEFTDGSKSVNQFLIFNDSLYCSTDQGPCILDTNGNWHTRYTGLQYRDISSIDVQDGTVYLTANNELFYSYDGGMNFSKSNSAFGYQILTTDSVFYLVSEHDFYMSRDMGFTWESNNDGIEYSFIQRLGHVSITNNYYYLATARGLYKSSSYPIQWSVIENPFFGTTYPIENVEAVDNTLIVGQIFPQYSLFFSLNYGYSFIDFGDYSSFDKIGETYYLLKDSILYSENEGQTWHYIPNDNIDYRYCIDRIEDTIILGGRDIYGNPMIEISYDMGDTWSDIIDNLPDNPILLGNYINQNKIIDGRVFVKNPKNGWWYRDDLLVGIDEGGIAEQNIILKTYPNPFTTSTTIEYELKEISNIQFTIYNVIGEVVYNAENHIMPQGSHTVIWSPSHLPEGLYYGVLRSEEGVSVLKMIKQ